MAFFEGLSQKAYDSLSDLNQKLNNPKNGSGIYICYSQRYHGKLYNLTAKSENRIYVGSSNFSTAGLSSNIECTLEVLDKNQKNRLSSFTDFLFSSQNAAKISHVKLPIKGSGALKKSLSIKSLDQLQKHNWTLSKIVKNGYPFFDFDLLRVSDKHKSSLNTYFGKGRLNRKSGVITPRGWYEVELIADQNVRSSSLYPRGNFTAYTNDGLVIPMKSQGDYFKNIRSEGLGKGTLHVFGMWIKGKLQKAEALSVLSLIDFDTFYNYGRSNLRFYKISEKEYFLDF